MPPNHKKWSQDWVTLPAAKFSEDEVRLCGTPGCTFRDYHDGPCSNAINLDKRQRYCPPPKQRPAPKAPKRKRRNEDGLARAAPALDSTPAEQSQRADGLSSFYHVHCWGQPLPDGPVAAVSGNASDDEADDEWRLEESAQRARARPEVSAADASFIAAWNAHVASLPTRLVSDRMVAEACRRFVQARASELRRGAPLERSFRAHLRVLWEHNLLHRDDVHDCLELAFNEDSERARCGECARPLHESHCALAGRARGVAAWPIPNKHVGDPLVLAAALREGGMWQKCQKAGRRPVSPR